MSPHGVRSDVHKVSPAGLPRRELIEDDTKVHDQVDGEEPMVPQPYTKHRKQLRNAGRRIGGLPWGRTHQLIIQCQIVSPENLHTRQISS